MLKKKLIVLFSFLALCSSVLSFYSVFHPDEIPYYISRPSFLIIMTFAYVFLTKKVNVLFLVCLFCIGMGEVLQYYSIDLLTYGITFYCLGLLFMLRILFGFVQRISVKRTIEYLLLFLIPFFMIYFWVMDNSINRVLSFLFGMLMMLIVSICLLNYFKNPTFINGILLTGFVIGVLASAVVSSAVLNIQEEPVIWLVTTFLAFLNHTFIISSFILRGNEEDS